MSKIRKIKSEMRAMLELAEKEGRAFTDEEQKKFEELRRMKLQAKQLRELEQEDDDKDEETPAEETEVETPTEDEDENKDEEQKSDDEEQKPCEEKSEDEAVEDEEKDEEMPAEDESEEAKRSRLIKKTKVNTRKMEKFSLIKALRGIANGEQMDDATRSTIEAGKKQMRGLNVSTYGQLVLPTERRGVDSIVGKDAIETKTLDVLDPLYHADALRGLGVTMQNFSASVTIPSYSGSTAAWVSETGAASDGAGTFSSITLTPKRLSVKLPISKQFLAQDTVGAETMLRRDIEKAISVKFEQTLFSAVDGKVGGSGDDKDDIISFKGLFNGVTQKSAAVTYADVLAIESALEKNKFIGANKKYLLSIEAKQAFRAIGVGDGTTSFRLAYQDNALLETPAVVSGNVMDKGVILADWDELVCAQFGALDVVVDPYTLAANGQIQLVVNAYFDAQFRRNNAYSAIYLK